MTLALLKYHMLTLTKEYVTIFLGLGIPVGMILLIPGFTAGLFVGNFIIATMVIGLMDAGMSHAYARQIKFLRRLLMTPVKPRHYIFTGLLSRYLTMLVLATVIVVISAITSEYGLGDRNWLLIYGALSVVFAMFYAIGMFTVNVLKNSKSSQGLTYVVFFGNFLFSGLMIPLSIMPQIVQDIQRFLPIAYGTGLLMNAWQGYSILEGYYLYATIGVTVAFTLLSIKFFKYE